MARERYFERRHWTFEGLQAFVYSPRLSTLEQSMVIDRDSFNATSKRLMTKFEELTLPA